MKSYQRTLEFLYARLPMYQRVGKIAFKKDLSNTLSLMAGLENPHRKFKSIHIAGTNGKGTSAHALAAVLQTAGYKTGLYTSPHLRHFTERIKVDGEEIPQKQVVKFVEQNQKLIEKINPSFFECTVAMAFDHFAKENVDIAVIETGLGGRLDSTNVITPEISLITTIGLEHTDLLGETLEKIAFEKAGIIKPRIPVVLGRIEGTALDVIIEVANRRGSRIIKSRAKTHDISLENSPPYFELNLPGILYTINELVCRGWKVSQDHIYQGISNFQKITRLKGRFQIIKNTPKIIADVSHNVDGLKILFESIESQNSGKLHLIFGTVKDKFLGAILSILPKNAILYFTQSSVPRSLPVDDLNNQAKNFNLTGRSFINVNDAKKAALGRAAPEDFILITGSTFVVAELEEL